MLSQSSASWLWRLRFRSEQSYTDVEGSREAATLAHSYPQRRRDLRICSRTSHRLHRPSPWHLQHLPCLHSRWLRLAPQFPSRNSQCHPPCQLWVLRSSATMVSAMKTTTTSLHNALQAMTGQVLLSQRPLRLPNAFAAGAAQMAPASLVPSHQTSLQASVTCHLCPQDRRQ